MVVTLALSAAVIVSAELFRVNEAAEVTGLRISGLVSRDLVVLAVEVVVVVIEEYLTRGVFGLNLST